ncbi:hypothetical protein SAMN05216436_12111 [bacterium A37T11]|nr:hypothetical protein SAMN05216436_12111 [bacterium A37T11]
MVIDDLKAETVDSYVKEHFTSDFTVDSDDSTSYRKMAESIAALGKVYWLPWSVLTISGAPHSSKASRITRVHQVASIVLDMLQCTI